MDLDFGHGFIPRIGSQNYKAVHRCLGPDSLFDALTDTAPSGNPRRILERE